MVDVIIMLITSHLQRCARSTHNSVSLRRSQGIMETLLARWIFLITGSLYFSISISVPTPTSTPTHTHTHTHTHTPHSLTHAHTGWDEGCMTMAQGEKANLIIAGYKGYGVKGFPAWGYPYTVIKVLHWLYKY